jgi:hypothetical protein
LAGRQANDQFSLIFVLLVEIHVNRFNSVTHELVSLVHGAEMRVAETRAVNRALRKAYGIGLCSVEELGWAPRSNAPAPPVQHKARTNGNDNHQNDQPRLRDRLCLLIRQHHLDAGLVKAYAAEYCGTPTLRDASRGQA